MEYPSITSGDLKNVQWNENMLQILETYSGFRYRFIPKFNKGCSEFFKNVQYELTKYAVRWKW